MSLRKIDNFRGDFFAFSNFYPAPVIFEGLTYRNSEAAFQSAKTLDMIKREDFCLVEPDEAKRMGRRLVLRSDWNRVRDEIMKTIVRDKFTRYRKLRELLLATADAYLEEGNNWGDTYWGVCNGIGHNKLGKILMEIREELIDDFIAQRAKEGYTFTRESVIGLYKNY